ncbi:MAG: hypothetical protein GY866_16020 [Proteobacteria bacterium]|nr:hypothetical protein [Pseudomonadota bacterium]
MTERKNTVIGRTVVALTVVYLVAVAIIIGYPYYDTFMAPWYEPVLEVGDKTFNMRYMVKRLRLRVGEGSKNQQAVSLQLIEEIQNRELIRKEAEKRGLTVPKEELAGAVETRVKNAATGEGEYGQLYESMLRGLRLEAEEFEETVRSDLLQQKLLLSFMGEMPDEVRQIRVGIILSSTAGKAEAIRTRLAIGESFGRVAKAESIDLKTSKNGGDLGWMPRGVWKLTATGQVRVRGILTKTSDEADLIRDKILEGSNFAGLARKYSLDATSRKNGGEMGWVSTDYKTGKQFAAESYDLKAGELSDPIDTQEGFWVIELIEKSPEGNVFDEYVFDLPVGSVSPPIYTNRGSYLFKILALEKKWPLNREHRLVLARKAMDKWLRETAEKGSEEGWLKWHWGSDSLSWALRNLK